MWRYERRNQKFKDLISSSKILTYSEAAVQKCSWERCSEKMQKIYGRTIIPKCNFNKVALQTLLKLHYGMGVLL